MSAFAAVQPQQASAPQEKTTDAVSLQRRSAFQPEPTTFRRRSFDAGSGTFAEPRVGYDFSRVPALTGMARQNRPLLRTQPMVQRFPKDEAASSSSCTSCSEAEFEQNSATDELTTEAGTPAPEAAPTTVPSEQTGEQAEETTTPGEIASPGLLVEDSATELAPGQMKKSEFLNQLRAEVCRSVEAALEGTGRTTADCPYLNHWFDFYNRKDSAHIERAIHRYAPDASSATTARGYISVIAQRARQAAETWVRTGEITGVPEGVATTVPGETPAENGEGAATSTSPVMLKARDGGARAADDPQAIQAELGEGQPLDSGVRSRMESAFGMDFAHVRTHTDTTAAELSNSLNARAFTVGEHVAFGTNEYNPGTLIGDALIAHEMAHVVQQSGTNASVEPMQAGDVNYNSLEDDADKSAIGALASLWDGTREDLADIARNAMPRLRSGLRFQRCDERSAPTSRSTPTTDPNINSWSTRSGDGDSTSIDNCCSICPVDLGVDCKPPSFNNGIELKATIANHTSGYSYDIKRTLEVKYWRRTNSARTWREITRWGKPAGTPDDGHDSDECLTPIASGSNHHIYSEDRPGLPQSWGSGSYTDKVQKANFIEFVRITKADGTASDDSNTQQWHTIMWITKTGSTWAVNTGESEIGTGHVSNLTP